MIAASVLDHGHGGGPASLDLLPLLLAAIAIAAYLGAAVASRRNGRAWPVHRAVLWCAGIVLAAASVVGPLARAAHESFVAHMWAHTLVGMLAPVLLVLAAPMTLALRTLSVTPARRLSRMLRSTPVRLLTHPVPAALISAGGLWVLYLSPVLDAMRANPLVHLFVHAHLLVAGYLLATAIIGLDPRPHPAPRMLTAVVLVLTIAAHSVLAKYLYAHPPAGWQVADVRAGAQVMYYAGAWVEALIVVVFCAQWYAATGRRLAKDGRLPGGAPARLSA